MRAYAVIMSENIYLGPQPGHTYCSTDHIVDALLYRRILYIIPTLSDRATAVSQESFEEKKVRFPETSGETENPTID